MSDKGLSVLSQRAAFLRGQSVYRVPRGPASTERTEKSYMFEANLITPPVHTQALQDQCSQPSAFCEYTLGNPDSLDVYIMYLLKRKKMDIPNEGGRSTNSTVCPGTNPDCNPRKHIGFSFQSIFIQQLLILLQFEAPGIKQRAEQTNFPVQYSLFFSLVFL